MKKNSLILIGCMLVTMVWSSGGVAADYTFQTHQPSDTLTASLTEKQRADLIKSIHSKVKRLEEYITLIASKKLSRNASDEKVKQCVELFMSEKNFVQSINKGKDGKERTKKRLVREYFVRLASIPATKVDITFYEVSKLTNLRPGPEPDIWFATAYIYQDTKIYYGNEVKVDYYDRTIKQVEVTTRIVKFGHDQEEQYVTKLGNIHVKELKIE